MNDDLLVKSKEKNDQRLVGSIDQLKRAALSERREDTLPLIQSLNQVITTNPWESLKILYDLVVNKRLTYSLKSNWSIAELRLNDEEYQFIYNWLILSPSKPSYGFLESVLSLNKRLDTRVTYKQAFGLILFIFECEYIRRNASCEEVWQTLSQVMHDSCCKSLFNSLGHATPKHKLLIKEVVIRFDIRNIFNNTEDVQSWFDTFFLQIGFPRKGIKNLSTWLSNINLTYAQKVLLNPDDLNYSESFRNLYTALKEIKTLGDIDEDTLKLITSSPWILEDWIPEILTVLSNANSFHCSNSLLTKVKLAYDDKPEFLVEVQLLVDNINEPKIFIECNGKKQCFLRNNQGKYEDLEHSNTIRVPFAQASEVLDIYVYDERGVLITEKEFELWSEDEVTLFDIQGRQLDQKDRGIKPDSIAYAIMPNDLKIKPDIPFVSGSDFNIYKLTDCSTQKYEVFLDDCLVWSSEDLFAEHNLRLEAKNNLKNIELKADPSKPNSFVLTIEHTSEVVIKEIVSELIFLPFKSINATKTTSEVFAIAQRAGTQSFKITYEYKNQSYKLKKELLIPKAGVLASYRRQEYQALNHNDHLTLNKLKDSRFKIFHQDKLFSDDIGDLFFIEGGNILYKFKDKLQKGIKKCLGYGGSLGLRANPINNLDDTDVSITKCVLDTGVIDEVGLNKKRVSIKLISSIIPTHDHQIICLANDSHLHLITNIQTSEDGLWNIEVPDENFACIGVVYKYQIIGQFWIKQNWIEPLEHISKNDSHIKRIALFYRCFKAPLLYSVNDLKQRGRLLSIISSNFTDIVSAWLSPADLFDLESVLIEMKPIGDDRNWHIVLSELFWHFDFNRLNINGIREDLILQLQAEAQIYSQEVERWAGVFMLLSYISPFFSSYMLNNSKDLLKDNIKQINMLLKIRYENQFKNRIEQEYGKDFDTNDLLKQISHLIADKYYMEEGFIKDVIDYSVRINQEVGVEGKVFGGKYYIERMEGSDDGVKRIHLLKNNLRFLLKDEEFRDLLVLKLMEKTNVLCLN